MDVLQGLQDSQLREIVGRILGTDAAPGGAAGPVSDVAQRWDSLLAKLRHNRFVLPIMGVQGSGKSTLLTALCFQRCVLPVDADETTSVPVSIEYADTDDAPADVVFKNGTIVSCPAEESALSAYAHQRYNPGNSKEVSHIVLRSSAPFLKNGLVLVDLPGLGSLTPANRETTVKYLEEATGILFMLRTVPTLTQSDANNIRSQWQYVSTAFVVQNRWTDESTEEVEESVAFNGEHLRKIAGALQVGGDATPEIIVVNAYNALKGRLTGSDALYTASNLAALDQLLLRLSDDWPQVLLGQVRSVFVAMLSEAAQRQAQLIELLEKDIHEGAEAARQQCIEARRVQQEHSRELDSAMTKMESLIRKFVREVKAQVDNWGQQEGRNMRAAMLALLQKDVTDGERLGTALRQHEERAYERLQEELHLLLDEVRTELQNFQVSVQEKFTSNASCTSRIQGEEGSKLRNFMPALGSGLGGAGGALAAAFLLSNPAGWVVAIGGVVAGLLGGFLGGKTKQHLLLEKIAQLEPQINTAIGVFIDDTQKKLNIWCTDTLHEMHEACNANKTSRQNAIERSYADAMNVLAESSPKVKQEVLAQHKADRKYIEQWMNQCMEKEAS